MTRRTWFQTALAAGAATGVSDELQAAPTKASRIDTSILRLQLRHTWTTTMSSSDFRDILHLNYTRDGITSQGEGAPIVRYHENAADAKKIVDEITPLLLAADPTEYRKVLQQVFARVPGQWAAKAAIDIALMDWVGQKWGLPIHRILGLDPHDTPITTYSIGIDTPEMTKLKVEEAAPYPVLKVKTGLGNDEKTIEAIRSLTNKPIRADANEGYKTKEEALERIKYLEKHNVEFIEQPMAADMLDEQKWLRSRVNMPIFADEACLRAEDIPKIAPLFDGVVIKLMKTGGIIGALRMIDVARAHGLKIMLGCMIESSVSITAAAQLTPLVDYADLDGNLLIANDVWSGVKVVSGKLVLPNGPGLGLTKRT